MKKESTLSLRCLIVDDELKAQKVLARLVAETTWLELLACCSDVGQALELIVTKRPHIIFLDVEMPGLSGLDLLKALPLPRPHVILVTAFREYALDAFEYDVTDFLLKPVSREQFLKKILKITIRDHEQFYFPEARDSSTEYQSAPGDHNASYLPAGGLQSQGFAWLRSNGKFHRVPHKHISAVQALKDYVKIFAKEGMLVVRENISVMERRLPDSDFIRIHRSYIINRHHIKTIEGNMVTMTDDKRYQIADSQRRDIILKLLTREQP